MISRGNDMIVKWAGLKAIFEAAPFQVQRSHLVDFWFFGRIHE